MSVFSLAMSAARANAGAFGLPAAPSGSRGKFRLLIVFPIAAKRRRSRSSGTFASASERLAAATLPPIVAAVETLSGLPAARIRAKQRSSRPTILTRTKE